MLDNYIAEVVVSKKELEETIERLGKTLTAEYQDKNPLVMVMLLNQVVKFVF